MQLGVSNQCVYGHGNHHAASFRAHGVDRGEDGTGKGSNMMERCKKRQRIRHWEDPELAWPHHISLAFPT